jgi:hypothetical protein
MEISGLVVDDTVKAIARAPTVKEAMMKDLEDYKAMRVLPEEQRNFCPARSASSKARTPRSWTPTAC